MRCYNGQPDSTLQRVLDEQARLRKLVESRGYSVTYFPNGEFYVAFDARHRPMSKECRTLSELEAATR